MSNTAKGNLVKLTKNLERRKKTMYRKEFSIFALLLIAMFVFAGCGSSGSSTALNTATDLGKTAKAELAFDFPKGEVGTALLSDATTHILVNVKQWTTDGMNNLTVVNTDKALLTKASPSTTIDLFPTYTRICASQYKGDPNDYVTSSTLETACTFGKLIPGTNTVNLTMLRGTWTLASPLTTSLGNVESVALARGAKSGSSYEGYDLGSDVYDGSPEGFKGPFDFPAQAINNWGSIYQAMFKVGGAYQFLSDGGAWYTNFFNTAEPNLLIGGGEEIVPEPTTGPKVKGVVIGGFGKATDADNVYRQGKQMIQWMGYRVAYYSDMFQEQSGCRYEGYWNEQSWYECYKPVLFTGETELTIEKLDGTNVTKDFVDQCKLQITGGNTIAACAGIETSASGTDGTETSYTHKVTSKFITKGANLCLSDEMLAAKDSSGNIICYNEEYSSQPITSCYDGAWNNSTWRCEETLSEACTDLGGTLSGQTCTSTTTYADENICYSQPSYYGSPFYDATGNLAGCSNNSDYTSGYSYTCWDGGTYNTATGRCEMDLQTACYGSYQDPLHESYDSTTQTCTWTDVGYLNVITFNPTLVTLTGVGSLPSSMGLTTSNVKNTLKW